MTQSRAVLNSAKKRRNFERMFLIRLAPIWFACRWRVMGHSLRGRWPKVDLANDLMGMMDYATEMKLVCKELGPDAEETAQTDEQAILEENA